jgi:hypothetical protein
MRVSHRNIIELRIERPGADITIQIFRSINALISTGDCRTPWAVDENLINGSLGLPPFQLTLSEQNQSLPFAYIRSSNTKDRITPWQSPVEKQGESHRAE